MSSSNCLVWQRMHTFLILRSTKFIQITHKNTVTASHYTHYTSITKIIQILLFRKKLLFWELYATHNVHVIGKAPYCKYQSKSDTQLPLSFKGLINRHTNDDDDDDDDDDDKN